MTATSSIVLNGQLQADGTVKLERPPAWPPGRVRVTLELLPETATGADRLPDLPWANDSIPAPFDLPRPGTAVHVQPRQATERLPAPFEWTDGTST
jgi:hypothetical protein